MNVKKLTVLGFICLTSVTVSLGIQQYNISSTNNALNLKSGIGTCFERVSQSFTALMTKNINSMFLSKTFLNTTSECIAEGNKMLGDVGRKLSKQSSTLLNQFSSDYYWLSQKSLKLKALISSSDIDLESSNVVQKFATLNDIKSNFSEEMSRIVTSYEKENTQLLLVASGSTALFLLSFALFGFSNRKRNKYLEVSDQLAKKLVDNFDTEKSDRLFVELFQKLKTKNVLNLYKVVADEKVADNPLPLTRKVPDIETTHLADSISKSVESFSSRIISLGVNLDIKEIKDFHVKGSSELIDQLVFHSLNYSLDFSKDKLIKINTSLLGSTAVLKIRLDSHCFNTNELNYLNSDNMDSAVANLDLRLLKELTEDLEGSFAVKNKVDAANNKMSAEIEFLFTVPAIRKTKETVKVMKGSKKEILAQMKSEA